MPIYNTPRLTKNDVDTMNAEFRALGLQSNGGLIPDSELTDSNIGNLQIVGLASYFGVTVGTARRWLAPPGSTYRRFVQATPFPNNPNSVGAIGRRVFCMDSSKIGFTAPQRILRLRIMLAAALAVPGGFQRDPIYHGKGRIERKVYLRLSNCMDYLDNIWTGGYTFYMERAWTQFVIEPLTDGVRVQWLVTVYYNHYTEEEGSDPKLDEFRNEREAGLLGEEEQPCP